MIVAVVDTGVRLDHPDLQGQLVAGYDFITRSGQRARDGNGIDPDPNDPGDLGAGAGSSLPRHARRGHDRRGARTMESASRGSRLGARVMPGARARPQRRHLLRRDAGRALRGQAAERLVDAARKRADIINLSLGGGGFDQAFQDVVDTASRGRRRSSWPRPATTIRARPRSPASYDGVVSVAAVDLNRTPAPYSNFGDQHRHRRARRRHVGGPQRRQPSRTACSRPWLTTPARRSSSCYAFYQGTSMATPHVSGVLALMRSVNPAITAGADRRSARPGQADAGSRHARSRQRDRAGASSTPAPHGDRRRARRTRRRPRSWRHAQWG